MTVRDSVAGFKRCPECRGERGHRGPLECVAPYEHEVLEDCGCPSIWISCRVCRGTGVVAPLIYATYMARGGAAPVQRQGHA